MKLLVTAFLCTIGLTAYGQPNNFNKGQETTVPGAQNAVNPDGAGTHSNSGLETPVESPGAVKHPDCVPHAAGMEPKKRGHVKAPNCVPIRPEVKNNKPTTEQPAQPMSDPNKTRMP
jgi:hypothetical protein